MTIMAATVRTRRMAGVCCVHRANVAKSNRWLMEKDLQTLAVDLDFPTSNRT
ncbi:hypothetical protein Plhal304r1_c011g0042381 [Plasmopara halstedii]